MARIFYAPTEDFIKLERATLAADATAGSSVTLTLLSNITLAENDYIAIGYEGNDICELAQVNQAVTAGTSVRVASLKLNHKKGEPIVVYRFNKRKFYGSTTADGSYTELTSDGSPKDIQVDDPQGTYFEYSDSTYSYFKATYYNSTTTDETSLDDAAAVSSDVSKNYATLYAIRKQAGFQGNTLFSDERIAVKRMQAESEINSSLVSKYVLPFSEVPQIISYICEILAAGYILYEEFGENGSGVALLAEARSLIKSIRTGDIVLLDSDYVELDTNEKVGALDGYPNATVTDTDPDARVFRMRDKY